jgi:hypothetical protein
MFWEKSCEPNDTKGENFSKGENKFKMGQKWPQKSPALCKKVYIKLDKWGIKREVKRGKKQGIKQAIFKL